MSGDGGAAAAVLAAAGAALAFVCCWLLAGWDRVDRERAFTQWLQKLRRVAALARAVFRRAGGALAARGGQQHGGQAVSLGEVSEMADIVRLGLTAGLSFDAALGLYCEGRSGELADRLARARLSWQTGVATREVALLAVARETGVRALEPFAIAAAQALELGAPLAETLAGQSRELRAAHRAAVERQIERAPVKLLIPTGTLILPALLISIVGPLLAGGGMI